MTRLRTVHTSWARRLVWLAFYWPVFAIASLTPTQLLCDGAANPLGIDSPAPLLSWQLKGAGRGLVQSAWQIEVASSRDYLEKGRADLWDSGKTPGHAQLHLAYQGRPLSTAQQVFWRVRVWDGANQEGPWSEVATWSMGVMDKRDWTARWITSGSLVKGERKFLGYSSKPTTSPTDRKWVQIDLGQSYAVEAIRLHALSHTVPERLGFPRWFRIEGAEKEDFSNSVVIADHTQEPTNLWLRTLNLTGRGTVARYIRLTATQLRVMSEVDLPLEAGPSYAGERGRLALSQIEVISSGKNVALGTQVKASDLDAASAWSLQALVDGQGVPGSNPRANETLRLRREFAVKPGLRRALLFVSGLGHYTLAVNGAEIGDTLLSPPWTTYGKTILYDTVDLRNVLLPGRNAIGLTLAGGMYSVPHPGKQRYSKFVGRERPLVAIAQLHLEYEDGSVETVVTDHQWSTGEGPIVYSHVYGGLDYDARRERRGWDRPEFSEVDWTPAVVVAGPGGELRGTSHAGPPLKAHEVFSAKSRRVVGEGVEVFDFGQNAALSIRLRVKGASGARVKIVPAELLKENGLVDRSSVGGSESSWNYVLSGDEEAEAWSPRLFYHGARYLQVEAIPAHEGGPRPVVETLEGLVVHAAAEPVGEFASSNPLLNQIRELVRWAQRSNMSHVLTDCPHRERLGWLEQYHLNGPSLRYEYGVQRLFEKTFRDMADAQRDNGLVPSTVPEYVTFEKGFRDSPEWGSAIVLAAWQHYLWTGNDRSLRQNYAAMKRYADYLASTSSEGLVSHGLGDWYDLGPNRPGMPQLTPIPLTATAFHYLTDETLAKIAQHLGRTGEVERLRLRSAATREAFNLRFYDEKRGLYATGSQTSNAIPLVMGFAPEDRRDTLVEALAADIRGRGNALTAGDIGYRYLLRALADAGRSDLIFEMNQQSDKPGYAYQLKMGATSLAEAWDANRHSSQNHFMLGQITEWLYQDLAGLGIDEAGPGFSRLRIWPQPVGDISWVRASHASPRGPVSVHWARESGKFALRVEVPHNSSATIGLPVTGKGEVSEGGKDPLDQPGVEFLERTSTRAIYRVGSGVYHFESKE